MSSNLIELGRSDKQIIQLDLKQLVASRAIVQARSGAGKSWFLRRLLEETYGNVQQIVIDPEGEFYTLREQFDYVLAGKGYDVHPQTQHADKFARKILELGVSCIFDLYEYEDWEKTRFVKLLLKGLHDAPKSLRHPVLVVIDEAQLFCPEEGSSESTQAVINLCSQGRKRGLCAVLATQRIALVKKSATANLANKLIGSTIQDIDQVRAGKELGLVKTDYIKLRDLKPGQFYAYGQAIRIGAKETYGIVQFTTGGIRTRHPEPGEDIQFSPSAPTPKALKALQELAKLPEKIAEEAKSLDDLRKENADLKRKLTMADRGQVVPQGTRDQLISLAAERNHWKDIARVAEANRDKAVQRYEALHGVSVPKLKAVIEHFEAAVRQTTAEHFQLDDLRRTAPKTASDPISASKASKPPVHPRSTPRKDVSPVETPEGISNPHKKILDALARFESLGLTSPKLPVVASLAGYAHKGGAWNNYKGRLNALDLIQVSNGSMQLTDAGRAIASFPDDPLTLSEIHDSWLNLYSAPIQRMLTVIIAIYPQAISKEELGEQAGYAPSGGAFNNYLGRLRSTGAVVNDGHGKVKASELVFPEGLA